MWRELNITKTAYENNRNMIPEHPRRNALSISRIYFVNIFYHKNAYLCIPIIHVPEYSPPFVRAGACNTHVRQRFAETPCTT